MFVSGREFARPFFFSDRTSHKILFAVIFSLSSASLFNMNSGKSKNESMKMMNVHLYYFPFYAKEKSDKQFYLFLSEGYECALLSTWYML